MDKALFLDPTVNPFFAARLRSRLDASLPVRTPETATLPLAPVNASPVPHLTSLYHRLEPGPYGSRAYPGNCGGNLIRDLLLFFGARRVLDPMTGSGTCRDVCRELAVECRSYDIRDGFDATRPEHMHEAGRDGPFDFIWAHPPYWRQKRYSGKDGDLSFTLSLEEFLFGYAAFIRNAADLLSPDGKLAILMGDYTDREAGFVPLTFRIA